MIDNFLEKLKLTQPEAVIGRINRELPRDIMEGVKKMRLKSTDYLYKEIDEKDEDYNTRLTNRTDLAPAFRKTIEDMLSKIFIKKISFESEEDRIKDFSVNVDNRGNDLDDFSQKIAHNTLVNGLWFIEVIGSTDVIVNRKIKFKSIDCNDVNWFKVNEAGKIDLFSYKVTNYETNLNDYKEVLVEYIYAYRLKTVKEQEGSNAGSKDQVFFYTYKKKDLESDYVLQGEPVLIDNLDEIPVVPVYFESKENEKGLNPAIPLQDLADKTILHWNKYSYYDNIVTLSSIPFIHLRGMDQLNRETEQDTSVKLTTKKMIATTYNTEIKWVQPTADASNQIKDLVSRIEEDMKIMGSEFLSTQSFLTATESVLNSLDTASKSSNFAIQIEKALKKCFEIAKKFLQLDFEYSLEVNKNIQIFKDENVYAILDSLHNKQVISDSQFIEYINKLKILGFDIDEEKRVDLLEKEGKVLNNDINALNNMLNQEEQSEDN